MLSVLGRPEIAAVSAASPLPAECGSASVESGDLIVAVVAKDATVVVSAWMVLLLLLVSVVSVGAVSLAEVWGEEMSALMVEADMGSRLSGGVGLGVVVMVLAMGKAVETRDEEVTAVSAVIVEIASGGGGVAIADDGAKDSEV